MVRGKILENEHFSRLGKVWEFHFQSGKFRKMSKVREKSGNLKIFPKKLLVNRLLEKKMGMTNLQTNSFSQKKKIKKVDHITKIFCNSW